MVVNTGILQQLVNASLGIDTRAGWNEVNDIFVYHLGNPPKYDAQGNWKQVIKCHECFNVAYRTPSQVPHHRCLTFHRGTGHKLCSSSRGTSGVKNWAIQCEKV